MPNDLVHGCGFLNIDDRCSRYDGCRDHDNRSFTGLTRPVIEGAWSAS